jgi:hypothetical protein
MNRIPAGFSENLNVFKICYKQGNQILQKKICLKLFKQCVLLSSF